MLVWELSWIAIGKRTTDEIENDICAKPRMKCLQQGCRKLLVKRSANCVVGREHQT